MGKTCRVVVCGGAGVGKTALLEQAIYGTHMVGKVSIPKQEIHTKTIAVHIQGSNKISQKVLVPGI